MCTCAKRLCVYAFLPLSQNRVKVRTSNKYVNHADELNFEISSIILYTCTLILKDFNLCVLYSNIEIKCFQRVSDSDLYILYPRVGVGMGL